MRPISFRIWHVKLKRLLRVNAIEFDVGEVSSISFLHPETKKFAPVDMSNKSNPFGYGGPCAYLMQFTGLRDKKGEEIFEGDIVTWNDEMGQIAFEYGRFWFVNSLGWHKTSLVDSQVEIIGNIWENKELAVQVEPPVPGISIEDMIEVYDKFHPKSGS